LKISEFKSQVSGWRRDKRGRLVLSSEMYALIEEVFRTSGLSRLVFGPAVGLSISTLYEARRRSQKGLKSPQIRRGPRRLDDFRAVKLVEPAAAIKGPWVVAGPSGIRVTCTTIDQLTQLWRALC